MKRRKTLLASVLCVLAVSISGCGNQIPDMTEEQQQAITDYAVDLVLKYDVNYQSRLVELPEEEVVEQEQVVTETPIPTELPGMEPVEQLPEVQVGENGTVATNLSVEEVLGWEGICQLQYQDFSVAASYETNSAAQGYVSVEAADGNKLLVVRFTLSNTSADDQHINMIANDAKFSLVMGGEGAKKCQMTLLENDLSTYFGDVPAGSSVEVVLVAEMAEELLADVASLTLNVENGEKISTIPLF